MSLAGQIKRLVRHSAVYGVGGLVSRILAVLLLPLYTRYLSTADYGAIETLIALTTVLVIVLRAGISSAFFRFYFDAPDDAARALVVRTSFWFTITSASAGLVVGFVFAPQIAGRLNGVDPDLVRAALIALWAQMNYEQLTSLFRVEERSIAFALSSLANVLITVAATVLLVAVLHRGAVGVLIGNFLGTLLVYFVLLVYRRHQLGLQFGKTLFREMNRFGLPLVPAALALWTVNLVDRVLLNKISGAGELGLYSLGVRVSSVVLLIFIAFRTAWPAFAYSIEDDEEARRTYGFVLTYLLFVCCWVSVALSLLAPWLVRLLAANPEFYPASRVVAPLAFGTTAYAAYVVVSIGVSRARHTQFNWIVTGAAAILNVVLNVILIPQYGMMGAAIATVSAYTLMFVGMTLKAQRVYHVPYQWRRVTTLVAAAVGLVVGGKLLDASMRVALALIAAYPLVLLPLGFYLRAEIRPLRRVLPAVSLESRRWRRPRTR